MPRSAKTSRYSTSRQKACQQCSGAKARCDRRAGGCTRCTQRGLRCAYPRAEISGGFDESGFITDEGRPLSRFSTSNASFPGSEGAVATQGVIDVRPSDTSRVDLIDGSGAFLSEYEWLAKPARLVDGLEALNFSNLELICPINADDINNRWLNTYIPMPGQATKVYPVGISVFIYQILKSYAAVAVNGRGILPFIHPKQLSAQPSGSPLTTCLNLIRISSNPLPGSEEATAGVLQGEMHSVYELRETDNDGLLFAAFQAYLIYTMVLFFRLNQACDDFFRSAMTNLQELACSSSRRGLVCAADQQRARPRWEEWITAEAKRRTLYVMYLFDSILSTSEGLPTFLGTELRGLPAPANRLLWQASSRYQWEREYNIYLAEWMEGGLTIDEFWPMPADLGEHGVSKRRSRVDCWIESLDEFGTMLYATVSCTHGA